VINAFLLGCLLVSCSKKEFEINLKWNRSYPNDNVEKNITGLKWCLSFLGSNISVDTTLTGLAFNDTLIRIRVDKLGFNREASNYLAQLNAQLKETGEYRQNNAIALGRYMALTIGSPFHYYKIAAVPDQLHDFKSRYSFHDIKGYVNNSGVSFVDRIILFSKKNTGNKQAYLSVETDSLTKQVYEFETVEVMPNGLSRFGVYDLNGKLKLAADPEVTGAGKPAKCMWCHESGIQPIFRKQRDYPGYLSSQNFQDSLTYYNSQLKSYQDALWKDAALKNRKNHTLMELTYIAFMEPSAEHLSAEWGLTVEEVKRKLRHLKTHRHEEFDYLGELYHRKEVDHLAPWKVLEVPGSIREKSDNEKDYLTFKIYLDHFLNNLSLSSSEKK
jgi:hypothetical protein